MNAAASLRRVEHILTRLAGDKALRDEALSLVREIIEDQELTSLSAEWWATYGPPPGNEYKPGEPLKRRQRALVDQIVTFGPCSVDQVALSLGVENENARKIVSRADIELLESGSKAAISIANGVVHTSTRVVISGDPTVRTRVS